MSALGHAHGNAFLGSLGAGNADEAEDNVVAGGDRVGKERQLLARRIGEDGFEDEAFTLSDEFVVAEYRQSLRPRRPICPVRVRCRRRWVAHPLLDHHLIEPSKVFGQRVDLRQLCGSDAAVVDSSVCSSLAKRR